MWRSLCEDVIRRVSTKNLQWDAKNSNNNYIENTINIMTHTRLRVWLQSKFISLRIVRRWKNETNANISITGAHRQKITDHLLLVLGKTFAFVFLFFCCCRRRRHDRYWYWQFWWHRFLLTRLHIVDVCIWMLEKGRMHNSKNAI